MIYSKKTHSKLIRAIITGIVSWGVYLIAMMIDSVMLGIYGGLLFALFFLQLASWIDAAEADKRAQDND